MINFGNTRILLNFLVYAALASGELGAQTLRPPAYPLVTHDPYFSIWSTTDKLTDSPTRHWTGKPQSLEGLIRVDGRAYRFLGAVPTAYEPVLPTGETQPYPARYTLTNPGSGWEKPDFDDQPWQSAPGPFGDTPDARTPWHNSQTDKAGIYIRRDFTYDGKVDPATLLLALNHDDAVDVYLNGVNILTKTGYISEYVYLPLSVAGQRALRTGKNVLAVHCVSPGGGSFVDVGLVRPINAMAVPAATQTGVTVSATQTEYTFTAGPVALRVSFLSPLLLDDLDVAARPVSYVTFVATARDANPHAVQLFFGEAGTVATNTASQVVVAEAGSRPGLHWLNVGTEQQPVLAKKGDNLRIDWGYAYLAAPDLAGTQLTSGPLATLKTAFVRQGALPADASVTHNPPTGLAQDYGLALSLSLGAVGPKPVSRHLLLAYDDLYAVQYFGQNLRAWWRRDSTQTMPALLQTAETDYNWLRQKSTAFDARLRADAQRVGGKPYADLCVLAYRQAIAAHKIVARPIVTRPTTAGSNARGGRDDLLFFSKENFSNGSIGTVDITYPSAPLFLLYNNELAKGLLRFIFEYSESGRWQKDFPAHDVGTYPLANGQTYGEDMPVEEAGNMMILTAAAVQMDGRPDFARQHWATLTKWVDFLKRDGFDPANQLCTDDFAGHLARNANLSVKAIIGIACYGKMARLLGDAKTADTHLVLARELARRWMKLDADSSGKTGGYYALTFDRTPGSWSQKYNLVWDKLLELAVFPPEVHRREIAFYLTRQQPYGLPLDSRKTYTKSDWIMWTATMADSQRDFEAFIQPIWKFANETPGRVPLTDWHETTNARQVGFQARSVVGGYFIKLLADKLKKQGTSPSAPAGSR